MRMRQEARPVRRVVRARFLRSRHHATHEHGVGAVMVGVLSRGWPRFPHKGRLSQGDRDVSNPRSHAPRGDASLDAPRPSCGLDRRRGASRTAFPRGAWEREASGPNQPGFLVTVATRGAFPDGHSPADRSRDFIYLKIKIYLYLILKIFIFMPSIRGFGPTDNTACSGGRLLTLPRDFPATTLLTVPGGSHHVRLEGVP